MAESGVIFKDRTNTGGENEMKNEKAMRPFGIRDKVGYMFGDFGNDFTFLFASTFLMIFYEISHPVLPSTSLMSS